jgi:hypothetical protein
MPRFIDWRIARCIVHRFRFNSEEASCPDCGAAPPQPLAAAPRRESWAGMMLFRCPFCGSKSIREASCSRYACRVQSSLSPRKNLNRCEHCGHRTKYPRFCTNYPCRKAAGLQGMYYRPAR